MIMADIFMYLFLILGGLTIVNAYWLLTESLFTRTVRRTRDSYSGHPYRTVFVGAAAGIPATFLAVGLASTGGGAPQFLGLTLLAMLVLAGIFGSAGLARLVGEGLPSERDAREPWRTVLRGGAALSIACLLPFAGWFIVLPITLASGVGALILALMPIRSRRHRAEVVDGVQA